MANKTFTPTIGNPDWDITKVDKEFKKNLKSRLSISLLSTEEEYQRVISYMYAKFPREMDITTGDNLAIQWHYGVARHKLKVLNSVTGKKQDMYAFAIYDDGRDHEPIAFAGSYFKLADAVKDIEDNDRFLCDVDGNLKSENEKNGVTPVSKVYPYRYQRTGFGYVLFIDPAYRRMGLATDLWYAEAELYRNALGIRFQREIQNEDSLKVTQNMFSDPSKCIVTSPGRLKTDGSRSQIRVLLDYTDKDLIEAFQTIPENLKTIYREPDWTFLKRETAPDGQNIETYLDKIWEAGKLPY